MSIFGFKILIYELDTQIKMLFLLLLLILFNINRTPIIKSRYNNSFRTNTNSYL